MQFGSLLFEFWDVRFGEEILFKTVSMLTKNIQGRYCARHNVVV